MAKYIPTTTFQLGVPTRAEDMVLRTHNRFAKEALRHVLVTHHARNIPKHFQRDARSRYGYKPRHPKYVRWKQQALRTGGLDLVKSGQSRTNMLRAPASIRMSGSAEGGKKELSGKLLLRFSFRGGGGRFRQAGTRQEQVVHQMIGELRRILPAEGADLARDFSTQYFGQVAAMPKRKRIRKVTI